MRQVWCADCGREKQIGTRMVYPRSMEGEPAEYERVQKGIARNPDPQERFMLINQAKFPLSAEHYICDNCGEDIRPGAEAWTWTVWTDEEQEPPLWEKGYIDSGI